MPVNGTGFGMPFIIAGKPVDDPSKRPGAGFNMVTPDYYKTFGIRMAVGRAFTEQDRDGRCAVAIVNDAFVKKYLQASIRCRSGSSIEQLIPGVTKLGPAVEWQIVGVYNSVRNGGPKDDGFPEIDVPFWQSPWPGSSMAVRTAGDPASVQQSLAAVIRSRGPRSADGRREDDGSARARIAGGRSVQHGAVRRLRGRGAAARRGRHLRRDVVRGRAADARDRPAHGARRRAARRCSGRSCARGSARRSSASSSASFGAYWVGRAMQGMVFGVGTVDPVAFSVVAAHAAHVVAAGLPGARAARRVGRSDDGAAAGVVLPGNGSTTKTTMSRRPRWFLRDRRSVLTFVLKQVSRSQESQVPSPKSQVARPGASTKVERLLATTSRSA